MERRRQQQLQQQQRNNKTAIIELNEPRMHFELAGNYYYWIVVGGCSQSLISHILSFRQKSAARRLFCALATYALCRPTDHFDGSRDVWPMFRFGAQFCLDTRQACGLAISHF